MTGTGLSLIPRHSAWRPSGRRFAELGVSFSEEIYDASYSPNWYSIYQALGLPRESWRQADHLWNKHYGNQAANLVEGAAETILELRRLSYGLGVVSSGTASRVLREIEHAGLTASFDVVICNEHIVHKKPHPEGLEIAIRKLNCTRQECSYVGDAPEDIEMGKRADVLTVGVRSSYPSSARLTATNRNTLRKNNGYTSFDWRLARPFKIHERYELIPTIEMFNTFNNANNVNPLSTPGLFNFDGFLRQGVGDPRQVQLAVKFTF